jgi:hypothetical protein
MAFISGSHYLLPIDAVNSVQTLKDLTAAFDFKSAPDTSWPDLPDTSTYVAKADTHCNELPSPAIPTAQSMPSQEEGTKVARPLPYMFEVDDTQLAAGGVALKIANTGSVGAAFTVHNYGNDTKPWHPKVPNADSCHGWTCSIEDQYCPPNVPGSGGNGYCCNSGAWYGARFSTWFCTRGGYWIPRLFA